jgi:hypothetical protein
MASKKNWTDFIPAEEPDYLYGDGIDQWEALSTGSTFSRDWILLETHQQNVHDRSHGDAIIVGDWKLIKWNTTCPSMENTWYFPSDELISTNNYTVQCDAPPVVDSTQCNLDWCLFNLLTDPCEHIDLSSDFPSKVQELQKLLQVFESTAVEQGNNGECNPLGVEMNGAIVLQPCDLTQ